MEMKRIVSVLGDDRGRVVSAREISKLPALTNPAAAGDVLLGKEYLDGAGAKQIGELVVKSGYELLGSGSYTWAGGSTTITIPISFSGTPKLFGLIADEPIANAGQAMCVVKLIDGDLYPEEFLASDQKNGFINAWGLSSAGTVMHNFVGYEQFGMNSTQMTCTQFSASYPWKENTYRWYIWGEGSGR